jgi:hypothetical protein
MRGNVLEISAALVAAGEEQAELCHDAHLRRVVFPAEKT